MASQTSKNNNVFQTNNESLHNILKKPLFVFQLLGMMPVKGILESESSLKFSWGNFRTIYAILTWFGFTFLTCVQIARFAIFDVDMAEIQRFWYFFKCSVSSWLLINLAKKWPEIMKNWRNVEKHMETYGWPLGIRRKINVAIASFITTLLIDYILVQINKIHNDFKDLQHKSNLETWNYHTKFNRFSYLYELLPYNFVSGIILLIVQLQINFIGTCIDLLIVMISLNLSSRQAQVTARIKNAINHPELFPSSIWMELREDYNRLESFCKYLNSNMGCLILISFAGNLGIILLKLFDGIQGYKDTVGTIYLLYVTMFVLFKIASVCIIGSEVNEESRKPLKFLLRAPVEVYNVEIERLVRQISRDDMALSGLGIFYVRRNIVLKIAGSIVTYELIVIQFASDFLKEQSNNHTLSI